MSDAFLVQGVRLRLGEADGAPVEFAPPDLRAARGDQIAIVGPSGSGKSTLLNLLAGLRRPDGGIVEVLGEAIGTMSPAAADDFRGRNIGYVFQELNLLAPFSALENAMIGVRFGVRGDRAEARAAADETRRLLERVGLGRRLHQRPARLSIGERQRVAIVRALAKRPALLLADEPTGALDPATGRAMFELLIELCRDEDCTLVVVTHDHALAELLPRRVEVDGWIRHEAAADAAPPQATTTTAGEAARPVATRGAAR
jgi:putative ABC transport system ATP-binding protein